jgi:hypothetical protein
MGAGIPAGVAMSETAQNFVLFGLPFVIAAFASGMAVFHVFRHRRRLRLETQGRAKAKA